MIRMTDLKLELNQAIDPEKEITSLKQLIVKKYRLNPQEIQSFSLYKKAVDARKKDHIVLVYSVDLSLANETSFLQRGLPSVSIAPETRYADIPTGHEKLKHRPVIVGFGPSGIFAAWELARRGYRPLILERGLDVDKRSRNIDAFYSGGPFSEQSSILFGEGGAGTFSDGKLTTLIGDLRCRYVLETLVKGGAPEDILYVNRPHIGTDLLKGVIRNLRHEITRMGGEIRFDAKVTDFLLKANQLIGLKIQGHEDIPADICLLGIGHSARDTFKALHDRGLFISQKPFSIGVRIEHPQSMIDEAQYGQYKDHPALGAADYKLSYHSPSGRSAYTFCMCPGGWVMCAASEEGGVVTNGMSERKRDHFNANAALLVGIRPEDFGSSHPLAGIDFQRNIEKKAFELAGGNYFAPVQTVGDFMRDTLTKTHGSVIPTYVPGIKAVRMTDLLPSFVTDTMKEALKDFDRKLKGFAMDDALMTGVETRSSSPVRLNRSDTHESSILGLYPMGEGAGYAGGIMSSAVDGLKTAESIISRFEPFLN